MDSQNNSSIEVHSHFSIRGSNIILFDQVTLINIYNFNIREATGTSFIFVYQFLVSNILWWQNSANFARKTNTLEAVDLLTGSCICTWKKLIKAKAISPLTFFKIFYDTKTLFESSHQNCSIKKATPKILNIHRKIPLLESLFISYRPSGLLQDTHTHTHTHTHTQILFFFRQNFKCKIMLTEVYLKPSWTSLMNLFCKIS